MAKDPAFLFYPGDWLGGTMGMTIEQKGAYLELLVLQFNCGKFTEAQAKQVLGTCFSHWSFLKQKFSAVGNFFLNERLLKETERRKNFSESRRNNAKGKKALADTYAEHMEAETKDETRIKNKIGGVGERIENAEEEILKNPIELERICIDALVPVEEAKKILREYHLYLIEKDKYPLARKKIFAGFERWLKNEKKIYGRSTHLKPVTGGFAEKPGTSSARIDKAKTWGSGPI